MRQDMKLSGWLKVTLFIVFAASALALTADNSLTARGDSGWGNTDWGDTGWRNTDWKGSDWGNADWGNTGWEKTSTNPQGEKLEGQLLKVKLGVKRPDGFCAMVVTWAGSSEEAVSAVAKNCQGCTINDLGNSDTPGADAEKIVRFCQ
jgi:hypothetical protein